MTDAPQPTASPLPDPAAAPGTPAATIRRGVPADAATISMFAARTFHDAFAAENREEDMIAYMSLAFGPEQQRRELSDPGYTYLLAEVEGELAGYALIRADEPPPCVTVRPAIEVGRFYVDRAWHGRAVAAGLMAACEAEARRRGGRAMWLGVFENNRRAIGFYAKSGFRDVGSHHFVLGTDVQTDRIMVRELGSGPAEGA